MKTEVFTHIEGAERNMNYIRQLAEAQFSTSSIPETELHAVTVDTGWCDLGDPWMDDSFRFALDDKEAKEMWGEDTYDLFITKSKCAIRELLHIMKDEKTHEWFYVFREDDPYPYWVYTVDGKGNGRAGRYTDYAKAKNAAETGDIIREDKMPGLLERYVKTFDVPLVYDLQMYERNGEKRFPSIMGEIRENSTMADLEAEKRRLLDSYGSSLQTPREQRAEKYVRDIYSVIKWAYENIATDRERLTSVDTYRIAAKMLTPNDRKCKEVIAKVEAKKAKSELAEYCHHYGYLFTDEQMKTFEGLMKSFDAGAIRKNAKEEAVRSTL